MKNIRLLIIVAIAACWALASWQSANWYANRKADELISSNQVALAGASLAAYQAFEERFNFLATVPALSVQLPEVKASTEKYAHLPHNLIDYTVRKSYWLSKPDLQSLNRQLADFAASFNLDVIFIVNADGYSIASSNSDTASTTIGTRYQDRKYFFDALKGDATSQYAVGRTTHIPGLFFSAPITVDGKIKGVFVIKADISRMQMLLSPYNAFLTDENGVIVLADQTGLIQHRLNNPQFFELSENQRRQQYSQTDFPILQMSAWDETSDLPLQRLDNLPYPVLTTDRGLPVGGLILHSYHGLPELDLIEHEKNMFAILLMLAGFSSFALCYQIILYLNKLKHSKEATEEITGKLKVSLSEREREIHRLAFVDTLTNLPNRNALTQHLTRAIQESISRGHLNALFLINIDGLKLINDRFGHDAGDQLLVAFAERLRTGTADSCYHARLGSDEFVAISTTKSTSREDALYMASQVGESLLAGITQPYPINGHTIHLTASIGVTFFGLGLAKTPNTLFKEVDAAMFQAKQSRRGGIHFFDEAVRSALEKRADITNRLLNAFRTQQFEQLYQPQVNADGEVVGVEALIRWNDAEIGAVSPAEFIPLAEAIHIIADIDRWVLNHACQTASAWRDDPVLKDIPISVNVSSEYFSMGSFTGEVTATLAKHRADPSQLMIELTEVSLIVESDQTRHNITELRRLGILVAIDDFGTGNSSLSYMQRFNVDQLKIDQSFVRTMITDVRSYSVIDFIINLANTLEYHTLAEGVETPEQFEELKKMGCSLFQGFLFSPPLTSAACEAFIKSKAKSND